MTLIKIEIATFAVVLTPYYRQFEQNITKRGNVPSSKKKQGKEKFPVGPLMLGILLFLIVGSALFQILNTTSTAPQV